MVQLPPLKILFADDEVLLLQVLSLFLRDAGHQVEIATDGRMALEKYGKEPWDVVITDRSMPDMTGEALALAIKQVNPKQPIIMVTGSGHPIPKGIDLLLQKPFTSKTLTAAVARVLAQVALE